MANIIIIGGVELTAEDAAKLHEEKKYLVTYGKIYQLVDRAGKISGKVVYTSKGMTRRGRFYAMTSETIYNIFGLIV